MIFTTLPLLLLASLVWAGPQETPAGSTLEKRAASVHSAKASYYFQRGKKGACGWYSQDHDYAIGLPDPMYKRFCGQLLHVTSPVTGRSVVVKVAESSGKGDRIILSAGAWDGLYLKRSQGSTTLHYSLVGGSKSPTTTKKPTTTTKKSTATKKTTTTKKAATTTKKQAATQTPKSNLNPGSGNGLIGFRSSNCGPSGASDENPNGSINWLNCGIDRSNPSSGWIPPAGVDYHKLKTVSIEYALSTNSVWKPCEPFVKLFEKYGEKHDLPPILLAAIALQESTCQPGVLGDNGGAFGLMQITKDKCGGRNAAGCAEPSYNIDTGAAYLASQIKAYDGNFLAALGQYNGWYPGLSYRGATAAANSGCCVCQNNLDYLHQMLNGWLLGKTGYTMRVYNNLAVCGE